MEIEKNTDVNEEESSTLEEDVNNEDSSNSEDENEEESSTSKEDQEDPEQEKDIPFHKHPRFKEIIEARKAAEEKAKKAEEASLKLTERLDKLEQSVPKNEQIPEWFVEGFGESPDLWSKFNEYNTQTREQLKAEIINDINSKNQEENQKHQEGIEMVNSEIQRLKDEGHSFDDNKLKSVMMEYGVLDFDKGLEIYKMIEKKSDPTAAKKKIASRTQSSDKAEGESKVQTLEEMIGKSW